MASRQQHSEQVIFVAGADFSGTTATDLVIGGLPGHRSLGECRSFLFPSHRSHLGAPCQDPLSGLWKTDRGCIKKFYRHALDYDQECHTLVDSSKSIPWLSKAVTAAKRDGLQTKVLIVIKPKKSYVASAASRGKIKLLAGLKWSAYHLAFACIAKSHRAVLLDDLTISPQLSFMKVSEWLDTKWTDEALVWSKRAGTIAFGSASARKTTGWQSKNNIPESTKRTITPHPHRLCFGVRIKVQPDGLYKLSAIRGVYLLGHAIKIATFAMWYFRRITTQIKRRF